VVVELINEAREKGASIIGIFHDEAVRECVATRSLDLTPLKVAA
jgi:alpha-D-ribose 1-methylphosphonate 5-triphosphate synthase subunit PhnL